MSGQEALLKDGRVVTAATGSSSPPAASEPRRKHCDWKEGDFQFISSDGVIFHVPSRILFDVRLGTRHWLLRRLCS